MQVEIVNFPDTPVAAIEHHGRPRYGAREHRATDRGGAAPQPRAAGSEATYGVSRPAHPHAPETGYRIDFCVAFDRPVEPNPQGVVAKLILADAAHVRRYQGSREHIPVVGPLYYGPGYLRVARSRETLPPFFHYVNVRARRGRSTEMLTDALLCLLKG